jgi:CRISPR-associated endonuclease/helicase Cas3
MFAKFDRFGRRHGLLPHGLDAAAVLEAAFRRNPRLLRNLATLLGMVEAQARAFLLFLVAGHDIGKVGSFQRFVAERTGLDLEAVAGLADYDHEAHGHWRLSLAILMRAAEDEEIPAFGSEAFRRGSGQRQGVWETWASCFAGHHGEQPAERDSDLLHFLDYNGRCAIRVGDYQAAVRILRTYADLTGWDGSLPSPAAAQVASYVLNGLATVADWIGSHRLFDYASPDVDPTTHWEAAVATAGTFLDDVKLTQFVEDWPRPAAISIEDFGESLVPEGQAFQPTPLQRRIDQLLGELKGSERQVMLTVEDLMGGGKTFAGDVAVRRLYSHGAVDGVFYGLPTMATADSAYSGKDIFSAMIFGEGTSNVLSHGRSGLNPTYRTLMLQAQQEIGEAGGLNWFASTSKRALLSATGVGTIDQALIGTLRTRFATVRLWGLWRKVLLVDEVHSFDDYMLTLLEALVAYQAMTGGSVILMSATLPTSVRTRLLTTFARAAGWEARVDEAGAANLDRDTYPLVTMMTGDRLVQTTGEDLRSGRGAVVPVRFRRAESEQVAVARIVEWARQGRCAVWFRNTVPDAMSGWKVLWRALDDAGLP